MDRPLDEPRARPDASASAAPGGAQQAPGYLPSLDGLRALGVTMVLAMHVGETFADVPGAPVLRFLWQVTSIGPAGVDLFFVLSGFLITGILLAARGKPRYFRSFYARRTLRIFPLYYAYLALLPLIFALIPAAHETLRSYARNWPWYALYLTNLKIVFFFDRDPGSVHHLWSLAIEEQFYLLWALVVAALPRRALAVFVGAALLLGPLGRALWLARGADPLAIYMSSWTHADGLLAGAAIALVRANARHWQALVRSVPVVFGTSMVSLLYIHGWLGNVPPGEGLYALVLQFTLRAALFGALLVWCVARDERGSSVPGLGNRLVRRVGTLSYGIYVYHFFLVLSLSRVLHDLFGRSVSGFLAMQLVIGLGSYAVAALSFRLIEAPALRLKRLFPRPA